MQNTALKLLCGSIRSFHRSGAVAFPRRPAATAPPLLRKTGMLFDDDADNENESDTNEGTSAGHLYLQQQRQVLNLMRLIEHDMPKLVRGSLCSRLYIPNH